jgi:hypothetical protein
MALINCPECNERISSEAFFCPKCGYVVKPHFMGGSWSAWGFEWKSKTEINGWPLVHVTIGFNRKTGKLFVSRGIIAIGQFGIGVITIAQFGIGFLFGLGQFIAGLIAMGQFAGGILFGLGQFSTGITAIGQFAIGQYVRSLIGFGQHIWTEKVKDPVAVEYFQRLLHF